jgi:DNA polymerase-3 subunit delta'
MAPRASRTLEMDLPESDRAGDMPHPRSQTLLFGHGPAVGELVAASHSGTLHHAWLISGPRGVGKATLAWRFARALLARGPADLPADLSMPSDDQAFRLIAASTHPDVIGLRRPWDTDRKKFKSELPVDEVRRLRSFFSKHPSFGSLQIAIVDCVDDMSIQAQNALLKILEEPPKAAILLLIAHTPGAVLPTVRSRCRTLQLRSLPPETMRQALQSLAPGVDDAHLALAAALAEGAPGQAAMLAVSGMVGAYQQILSVLATLPQLNHAMLHGLADQFMKQFPDRGVAGFARLLSLAMQRHLRSLLGTAQALPEEQAAFRCMTRVLAPEQWSARYAELQALEARALALNLDKKQFVLNVFYSLEAAVRS